MGNVGVERNTSNRIKDKKSGEYCVDVTCDTLPKGECVISRKYLAPYMRCNRIAEYTEIWREVEAHYEGIHEI